MEFPSGCTGPARCVSAEYVASGFRKKLAQMAPESKVPAQEHSPMPELCTEHAQQVLAEMAKPKESVCGAIPARVQAPREDGGTFSLLAKIEMR